MAVVTRPPLHEYIRKLLYHDLGKNTTEKVLKQIRKLDWSDPEMAAYATGCISAVWNIKYYNIRFAASLLAGLASHHDWVASRVVDGVLEDIRMEMEKNDPSHNQRRISVVKYLGELYNYRLVDSSVIFKVLYSFLTFGALGPEPGAPNPFDPPEHMLRIRLVCVMLETCAIYFSSGSSKRKLDYFFAYFQRYYWLKRAHPTWTDEEAGKPFPVAIIHVVSETIPSLRPKVKLCESLDEALDGVEKIEEEVLAALAEKNPELSKNLRGTSMIKQPLRDAPPPGGLHAIAEEGDEEFANSGRKSAAETHDSDDEDSNSNSRSRSQSQRDEHHFDFEDEDDSEDSDDEDDDEDDLSDDDDDDEDEDDDTQEDDNEEADDVLSEEDDDEDLIEEGMEDLLVPSAPKHIECEEDDEFKAMFDKLLNENITESRAAAVPRSQQISVIAPMHSKIKKNYEQLQRPESPEGTVQFSVLLRKNNKPAYKEVAVPLESDIARNLQMQEEADRLEKERVKQLTLEINERQEEEDFNEALAAMQRPTLVNVNRQRRSHHQHQRGVPDGVDAMFGAAGPKRQAPR